MPKKGELSQYHEIKPVELALELAKLERLETQKQAFKASLIESIIQAYKQFVFTSNKLGELPRRQAIWKLEKARRDPNVPLAKIKQEKSEQESAGETLEPEKEEILLNHVQSLRAHFSYENEDAPGKIKCSVKEVVFDLTYMFQNAGIPDEEIKGTIQTGLWADIIPFKKIWDKAKAENPDGAEAYLSELIDRERGFIENRLTLAKEKTKTWEKERKQKISRGEIAGIERAKMMDAKIEAEYYNDRFSALLKFAKSNRP